MKRLWRQRLKQHAKGQSKYLQLVFNDHFVLVLVILLGALLYGYSQVVKTLTASWWLAPAMALVFSVLLALGRLATLTEPADATFLLPKSAEFSQYLFKARRYSLLLPCIVLIFATIAALPLLPVLKLSVLTAALPLGVALLLFKDSDLWLQLLAFYPQRVPRWCRRELLLGVAFLALWAGFWWHPAIALAAALVIDLSLRWRLGDLLAAAELMWVPLIAAESRRMGRIYRFYNLFTDVPGLGGGVKRRRYLDGLAKLVPRGLPHTWQWLFVRGFLRRTEFFGLYLRLVVIGALVIALVDQWWLVALLAALFTYMIGFQLLPLYQVYDEIVLTYLYPLPQPQKPQAFKHLLAVLLVIAAVVLAGGAVVSGHFLAAGGALAAGLIVAVLVAWWYLPIRLAKLAAR